MLAPRFYRRSNKLKGIFLLYIPCFGAPGRIRPPVRCVLPGVLPSCSPEPRPDSRLCTPGRGAIPCLGRFSALFPLRPAKGRRNTGKGTDGRLLRVLPGKCARLLPKGKEPVRSARETAASTLWASVTSESTWCIRLPRSTASAAGVAQTFFQSRFTRRRSRQGVPFHRSTGKRSVVSSRSCAGVRCPMLYV